MQHNVACTISNNSADESSKGAPAWRNLSLTSIGTSEIHTCHCQCDQHAGSSFLGGILLLILCECRSAMVPLCCMWSDSPAHWDLQLCTSHL